MAFALLLQIVAAVRAANGGRRRGGRDGRLKWLRVVGVMRLGEPELLVLERDRLEEALELDTRLAACCHRRVWRLIDRLAAGRLLLILLERAADRVDQAHGGLEHERAHVEFDVLHVEYERLFALNLLATVAVAVALHLVLGDDASQVDGSGKEDHVALHLLELGILLERLHLDHEVAERRVQLDLVLDEVHFDEYKGLYKQTNKRTNEWLILKCLIKTCFVSLTSILKLFDLRNSY